MQESNYNIIYVLQKELYKEYEYGLPDDPGSMARYIMHVLDSNGYVVSKKDNNG